MDELTDEDDDALNLSDAELFDITGVTVTSWESKDRKIATFRMRDEAGMCDMKIYLALKRKVEQMEGLLNMHPENDKKH